MARRHLELERTETQRDGTNMQQWRNVTPEEEEEEQEQEEVLGGRRSSVG